MAVNTVQIDSRQTVDLHETHTRASIVIRVQIYATQEVLATVCIDRQEKERVESTRSSFSVFHDVPSSFDGSHKLLKDITVMLCQ